MFPDSQISEPPGIILNQQDKSQSCRAAMSTKPVNGMASCAQPERRCLMGILAAGVCAQESLNLLDIMCAQLDDKKLTDTRRMPLA